MYFFYVFVLYTFLKRFPERRSGYKVLGKFHFKKEAHLVHASMHKNAYRFISRISMPFSIPFQFTLGHFLPFLTIRKTGTSFHRYMMGVAYLTNNTLTCNDQYNILLDTLFSK